MSDFDTFTDYRCLNGHIFSVPWGDESPRSTVVCPRCGATSFIHAPERGAAVSPSQDNERRDCVAPSSHAEPGLGTPADEPSTRHRGVSPSPSSPPEWEGRVVFELQEDDVCEECGAGTVVIRKLIECPPSSPPEREVESLRARVTELEDAAREVVKFAPLPQALTSVEAASFNAALYALSALLSNTEGER